MASPSADAPMFVLAQVTDILHSLIQKEGEMSHNIERFSFVMTGCYYSFPVLNLSETD
jgi:hypothetical protein